MTTIPTHPRGRGIFAALTTLAITAIVLTMAAVIAGVITAPASHAASTLGGAAAEKGRTFGAAVANNHLGEAQYASTLDTEFSGLTPENEMKWETIEPSQGQFNFGSADAIVNHAQSRNMKIRGHTLVWHSQLAGWVNNISTGAALTTAMRNHINGVMAHYLGDIVYWDVVNEAFEENGARRQSVFQQRIGNGYIEDAFRTARAADPNAKLCYNDFNIEGQNAKSNAVFQMVSDFKARGVPIDCVGFQAHFIVGQIPGDFQANMQRFANLGVDVNITELDIRMPTPPSSANLQTQANNYATVTNACLAISRCTSITVWGIPDKYSWVPSTFPGQGAPLLFDDNYNKKAAYNSTLTALGGTSSTPPTTPPTTTPPTTTPPAGACRITYAMNAWNTGFTANITIANTSSSAVNGWTLAFTLPGGQTITSGWNATYSPTSGQVTARNVSYNGTINPGQSTDIGFQANHTGNTGRPASFTLNGTACTVA
ncbi:MAG TPA: endo-1,4-beta-xylanase [Streptosporangiaceae bacterium]|nr:endo-1,4-beta-xylanase [Streptosporangiaceae bacterium]